MLTITHGIWALASSANDSCIRLMPCPVDAIMARTPQPAAPHTMLIASSSLGVHAHPARLRQAVRHVLEDLGRGRDRIARVEAAARLDRRLGDRVAPLHEYPGHASASAGPRYTSKQ